MTLHYSGLQSNNEEHETHIVLCIPDMFKFSSQLDIN